MPRETIKQTIGVAAGVCVVCSVLVSTAAVVLKPIQDRNRTLERRRNILIAAGLLEPGRAADVDKLFSKIERRRVDLSAHAFVEKVPDEANTIDVRDPKLGLKHVDRYQSIYLKRKDGKIQRVVLPIEGKGLWSTMYGFLALGGDMTTIKSLAFYQHGETPGLGGEVDNPNWKRSWIGKQAFDEEGKPWIRVVKGRADPGAPDEVDGLSGATLTSRGVENLVRFWLGQQGYGPVLKKSILEKLKPGGDDG